MAKKNITYIRKKKEEGKKIIVLTAYEYIFASILSSCGVDILLVGDSLASVFCGCDNTLPVTVDEMLYHTKAVVKGAGESMVIADMPFMSYHVDMSDTKRNVGRMIKEGGAQGVKIEGGSELVIKTIAALTEIDIPVMAHLGLTPQSIHQMGGYKVQGKNVKEAKQLIEKAKRVQDAGAFSLVLECIPSLLAQEITESLDIPTISIGAGRHCDGQVLVTQDILGLYERLTPKFVKQYKELGKEVREGVKNFIAEVEEGKFPADEHSFK